MVNRCVCRMVLFKDALDLAKDAVSLEEVQKIIPCADKCGLCAPYIEDLLKERKKEIQNGSWEFFYYNR